MTSQVQTLITSITERIRASASVDTIYGEPLVVEGRTVIPVGKVAFGFGAGGGQGPGQEQLEGAEAEAESKAPGGGGAGGGVSVNPVGFLVINPKGERFVPVSPSKKELAAATLVGFGLGFAVAKRIFSRK